MRAARSAVRVWMTGALLNANGPYNVMTLYMYSIDTIKALAYRNTTVVSRASLTKMDVTMSYISNAFN